MTGDDICVWLTVLGIVGFVVLVLVFKATDSIASVLLILAGFFTLAAAMCCVVVGMVFLVNVLLQLFRGK